MVAFNITNQHLKSKVESGGILNSDIVYKILVSNFSKEIYQNSNIDNNFKIKSKLLAIIQDFTAL